MSDKKSATSGAPDKKIIIFRYIINFFIGAKPQPLGETLAVDDLIQPPGRYMRPPKIVVIFRGLPGSGKSYVAKNVKSQESEFGSETPRILALDDYFECDGEVSQLIFKIILVLMYIIKYLYTF